MRPPLNGGKRSGLRDDGSASFGESHVKLLLKLGTDKARTGRVYLICSENEEALALAGALSMR